MSRLASPRLASCMQSYLAANLSERWNASLYNYSANGTNKTHMGYGNRYPFLKPPASWKPGCRL